jgi:hypothetical protein
MDIKLKICDNRTWTKHLFFDISSTNIDTLAPSLYQCVETRSIEFFRLSSQPLPHLVGHRLRISNVLERISLLSCEPFYTTNTSHREQETFLYEHPLHRALLPTKTHNRTLLFGSTNLKHGRHFDYWNQPLNMRMRVCYLDCNEDGQCCYLVINIEKVLRPLQLFYFHLWPIYYLSFVKISVLNEKELFCSEEGKPFENYEN